MSFAFPKEIVITKQFVLVNGNNSSQSVTFDPAVSSQFTSEQFVNILNVTFPDAGFVLEDDQYLTEENGKNIFIEKIGGALEGAFNVVGSLDVSGSVLITGNSIFNGNVDISGNLDSNSNFNLGKILTLYDALNISGGGLKDSEEPTSGFKPILIGNNVNIDSVIKPHSCITIGNNSGINRSSSQIGAKTISIGNYVGYNEQGSGSIGLGYYSGYSAQGDYAVSLGYYDDVSGGQTGQGSTSISIGRNSGYASQGIGAIAVGSQSGRNTQGGSAISIGVNSGYTGQSWSAIAIGLNAGNDTQGGSSIAVGYNSGNENQGTNSISIGSSAGELSQGAYSIAIGRNSGSDSQQNNSIAFGTNSGNTNQQGNSVAIGSNSAVFYQSSNSIAIGNYAAYGIDGDNTQGQTSFSIAIGESAGKINQGLVDGYTIAMGAYAGYTDQNKRNVAIGAYAGYESQGKLSETGTGTGGYSIAIGDAAGYTNQIEYSIAIGANAGRNDQSGNAIAIGRDSGNTNQGIGAIALGSSAGTTSQGLHSTAIGYEAGKTSQNTYSIAIGDLAGTSNQNEQNIAIGTQAGKSYQGDGGGYSIAIGSAAGQTNQTKYSIAIGSNAGNNTQKESAIAIGQDSGKIAQGNFTVALGYKSGQTNQRDNSIAVGAQSGYDNQSAYAIAIGTQAGNYSQGGSSIALGYQCGYASQSTDSVAIGREAGKTSQNQDSISIGNKAGYTTQGSSSIALGFQSGYTDQSTNSVAIGHEAGKTRQGATSVSIGDYYDESGHGQINQGAYAISMGQNAAKYSQGDYSIAIGSNCGKGDIGGTTNQQGAKSVAIGFSAGLSHQGTDSIGIGTDAAQIGQGNNSIALGINAGQSNQSVGSISIGDSAGKTSQSNNSIAIGTNAGLTSQGSTSIAIGRDAGKTSQHAKSIIFNASYSELNSTGENCLFIKPVRNLIGDNGDTFTFLQYNQTSGEITHHKDLSMPTNSRIMFNNGSSNNINVPGPNMIKLWSNDQYGFGIDTYTLKYSSGLNHNFYHSGTDNSNGTLGMQLEFNDLKVTGKVGVNNITPIHELDIKGISHTGSDGFHSGHILHYYSLKSLDSLNLFEKSTTNANHTINFVSDYAQDYAQLKNNVYIVSPSLNIKGYSAFKENGIYTGNDVINTNDTLGYTSQRILVKLSAAFYSQDYNTDFFSIELLNGLNGTLISEIYKVYNATQANSIGFNPIVCDITPYLTEGIDSIKIKLISNQTNQNQLGGDDKVLIKNLTVCVDDSTPWYQLSAKQALFTDNVGIGTNDPSNNFKLDVSGSIAGGYDTDTTSYFGRVAVGYAHTSDYATFSHINYNTSQGYALQQSNSGKTYINAANNESVNFRINDNTKMYLASGGNFGIGTTDPQSLLDVNGSIRGNYDTDTTSYFGKAAIGFNGTTNSATFSHIQSHNGDNYALRQNENGTTNLNGTEVRFRIGSNEKMILNSSGNFGIGTTTPSVLLDVSGTNAIKIPVGTTGQRPIITDTTGNSQYGYIRYNTSNSSFEGFGAGNAWGSLGGVKDVDQDTYISAEDAAGVNNNKLKFFTVDSQRMVIDSSGTVGIGTLDPSNNFKLDVSGSIAAGHDTDTTSYFGNAAIGYCGVNNWASFAHINSNIAEEYAITQNSNGTTYINAAINRSIEFKINNEDKLTIDSNGNFGIGTTTPSVLLDVSGTNAIKIPVGTTGQRPNITDTIGNSQYGYIRYNTSNSSFEGFGAGNAWGSLGGVKDVDQDTYISAEDAAGVNNNKLKFFTVDSQRMVIDSSGTVGIGTLDPSNNFKLDVSGSIAAGHGTDTTSYFGNAAIGYTGYHDMASFGHILPAKNGSSGYAILQKSSGNTLINSVAGQDINFTINNETKMILDSGGNVGIGTNSPSSLLDVSGDIKLSGYLIAGSVSLSQTELGRLTNVSSNIQTQFDALTTYNTSAGKWDINGINIYYDNVNGSVGIGTNNPSNDFKLDVSGSIAAGYNTETISYFGNAAIGGIDTDSDMIVTTGISAFGTAIFGHARFYNDSGGFAILQTYYGRTYINAASNQSIHFTINGVTQMMMTSNGKVGIGTTNPAVKLDVDGDIRLTGSLLVNHTTYISQTELSHLSSVSSNIQTQFAGVQTQFTGVQTQFTDLSTSIDSVGTQFTDVQTQVTDLSASIDSVGTQFTNLYASIDSAGTWDSNTNGNIYYNDGFVGIGTNDPIGQLHISSGNGSNGDCTLILESDIDNNNELSNPQILFRQDGGNDWSAIGHTDTTNNNALVLSNSVNGSGGIIFKTDSSNNGYTVANERMRISSYGNLGIGTINPAEKLHVNGTVLATSYNATSDVRHKENICDLENALEKICKIRGVNFNFKDDDENKIHAGILAQEVDTIIPEAINKNCDDKWSANYNSFIGYLIESVKTLKTENDNKDNKITDLKNTVNELKTTIDNMTTDISAIKTALNI